MVNVIIIVVGDKIVWTGRDIDEAWKVRDAIVKSAEYEMSNRPAVYQLASESGW